MGDTEVELISPECDDPLLRNNSPDLLSDAEDAALLRDRSSDLRRAKSVSSVRSLRDMFEHISKPEVTNGGEDTMLPLNKLADSDQELERCESFSDIPNKPAPLERAKTESSIPTLQLKQEVLTPKSKAKKSGIARKIDKRREQQQKHDTPRYRSSSGDSQKTPTNENKRDKPEAPTENKKKSKFKFFKKKTQQTLGRTTSLVLENIEKTNEKIKVSRSISTNPDPMFSIPQPDYVSEAENPPKSFRRDDFSRKTAPAKIKNSSQSDCELENLVDSSLCRSKVVQNLSREAVVLKTNSPEARNLLRNSLRGSKRSNLTNIMTSPIVKQNLAYKDDSPTTSKVQVSAISSPKATLNINETAVVKKNICSPKPKRAQRVLVDNVETNESSKPGSVVKAEFGIVKQAICSPKLQRPRKVIVGRDRTLSNSSQDLESSSSESEPPERPEPPKEDLDKLFDDLGINNHYSDLLPQDALERELDKLDELLALSISCAPSQISKAIGTSRGGARKSSIPKLELNNLCNNNKLKNILSSHDQNETNHQTISDLKSLKKPYTPASDARESTASLISNSSSSTFTHSVVGLSNGYDSPGQIRRSTSSASSLTVPDFDTNLGFEKKMPFLLKYNDSDSDDKPGDFSVVNLNVSTETEESSTLSAKPGKKFMYARQSPVEPRIAAERTPSPESNYHTPNSSITNPPNSSLNSTNISEKYYTPDSQTPPPKPPRKLSMEDRQKRINTVLEKTTTPSDHASISHILEKYRKPTSADTNPAENTDSSCKRDTLRKDLKSKNKTTSVDTLERKRAPLHNRAKVISHLSASFDKTIDKLVSKYSKTNDSGKRTSLGKSEKSSLSTRYSDKSEGNTTTPTRSSTASKSTPFFDRFDSNRASTRSDINPIDASLLRHDRNSSFKDQNSSSDWRTNSERVGRTSPPRNAPKSEDTAKIEVINSGKRLLSEQSSSEDGPLNLEKFTYTGYMKKIASPRNPVRSFETRGFTPVRQNSTPLPRNNRNTEERTPLSTKHQSEDNKVVTRATSLYNKSSVNKKHEGMSCISFFLSLFLFLSILGSPYSATAHYSATAQYSTTVHYFATVHYSATAHY